MGSHQDVSNPLWLLGHPQPCCGEGEVPPNKLCAAGKGTLWAKPWNLCVCRPGISQGRVRLD